MQRKETNKEFIRQCKVINLELEYPGYDGEVKYAVITNLSEESLNKRFNKVLEKYRPFIIISRKMWKVMFEYCGNEKKYKYRNEVVEIVSNIDEEDEAEFEELSVAAEQTYVQAAWDEEDRDKIVRLALEYLTPIQRYRLIAYYVNGKTLEQIAEDEGISIKNAWEAVKRAEMNFSRAYRRLEAALW